MEWFVPLTNIEGIGKLLGQGARLQEEKDLGPHL